MTGLAFRAAVPGDEATVHGFVVLLEAHVGARAAMPGAVEDIRRAMFADTPALFAELLERGGEPVGMATWYPVFSTWLGRPGVYVLDLFVAERERGRGHARRILGHMAALARNRGAAFLKLEVDRTNDGAAAVYGRMGFTSSGTEVLLLTGGAFDCLTDGG